MDVDSRSPWRWPLLFSIVVLNIFLPNLVLSYGVIWARLTALDVPLWLGLAAPTLFLLTNGLSQCWFREAADSWGESVGYRVMATVGLVIVVTGQLLCVVMPLNIQPIVYGVIGGLGSSLISAQVDALTYESYDTRLGVVRALCLTGQAVGLSIFPHILSAIINNYDYSSSFLLIGGIMLQTLPAIMLLRIDITKKSLYLSSYRELSQTFVAYKNEAIDNIYSTEIQLHNLNNKCWKNPSDDNFHKEGENDLDNINIVGTSTPPPSPEEKRRNIFGVEILPEIPEESEESEIDELNSNESRGPGKNKKRLSSAIRRLSNLGDNLDECIVNEVRKHSQSDRETNEIIKECTEIEIVYESVEPITDIQSEKIFYSLSFRCQSAYTNLKRKLWIPSYRAYRIKRRLLYIIHNLNDTFLKPLKRSLSYGKFYPALLLSLSKHSLTAIYIVLLPMIALKMRPKMSLFETNFLISLHGFTWICFLLCTPWLASTAKTNYKYVACSGLIISTYASFVLAKAKTHDSFSIGCVIGGFGFGAITSCWETAVQEYVGARKWPKIHSTLETLSAILLGLLTTGISFVIGAENGLQFSMYILGLVLSGVTVIWIIIAAQSIYTRKMRDFSFNTNS